MFDNRVYAVFKFIISLHILSGSSFWELVLQFLIVELKRIWLNKICSDTLNITCKSIIYKLTMLLNSFSHLFIWVILCSLEAKCWLILVSWHTFYYIFSNVLHFFLEAVLFPHLKVNKSMNDIYSNKFLKQFLQNFYLTLSKLQIYAHTHNIHCILILTLGTNNGIQLHLYVVTVCSHLLSSDWERHLWFSKHISYASMCLFVLFTQRSLHFSGKIFLFLLLKFMFITQ